MSKGIMSNSIMNAAAGMLLLVTGFACSILVARLLGPEANGTIAFALWIGATGALVAELGTGVLLLRLLPQLKARGVDEAGRRGFAAYLALPVIASTLLLVALYFGLAFKTPLLYGTDVTAGIVVLTAALLIIQSIGSFSKNFLIGEQRVGTFFRITALSSLLQMTFVIAGAAFYGIDGALFGYIAGQCVQFLYTLSLFGVRRDNAGYRRRYLLATSAVLFFEYVVSAIFLSRPELFFLQHFRSLGEVGYYAVALSLANLALQLPVQLTGSLLPYYAERREASGGTVHVAVFDGVVRSFAYITFPLCFGLAAIAHPLVTAVYGAPFAEAGLIVAILAAGSPAYVLGQLVTQYLYSMDRVKIRLVASGIGATLMVIGCLLVVPTWGGAGAATVRGVVFAVIAVLLLTGVGRGAMSAQLPGVLIKVALAGAGCGLAAWPVAEEIGGFAGVVAGILAGAIAYAALLRLLRAVPPEDGAVIDGMLKSLPMKPGRIARRLLAFVVPMPAAQPAGE
ncbi:oligosaccharide flippase family protein [Shinella sp. WSJ-2]|uniref:lipopolysaccharide biosynthesis protein n=1 Tax=Shinella sp. WSJ-2 TaxID=2303749 RepID=UPI00131400C9|nr:oligosaccharide flippase family protein [Shinella sp. WSJ-2]